jgi:hypothetical protein
VTGFAGFLGLTGKSRTRSCSHVECEIFSRSIRVANVRRSAVKILQSCKSCKSCLPPPSAIPASPREPLCFYSVCCSPLRLPTLGYTFDSFAPAQLIRRISRPAPPSELPCGSLSSTFPKGLDSPELAILDLPRRSRFALSGQPSAVFLGSCSIPERLSKPPACALHVDAVASAQLPLRDPRASA